MHKIAATFWLVIINLLLPLHASMAANIIDDANHGSVVVRNGAFSQSYLGHAGVVILPLFNLPPNTTDKIIAQANGVNLVSGTVTYDGFKGGLQNSYLGHRKTYDVQWDLPAFRADVVLFAKQAMGKSYTAVNLYRYAGDFSHSNNIPYVNILPTDFRCDGVAEWSVEQALYIHGLTLNENRGFYASNSPVDIWNINILNPTQIIANGTDDSAFKLVIDSDSPTTGVPITVSKADSLNSQNGSTGNGGILKRLYSDGTSVTLTAPATAPNGNVFSTWWGCTAPNGGTLNTTARTCTTSMNKAANYTASYVPPVTTTVPTVTTNIATNVLSASATLNATITNDGGSTILERRFEWSTNPSFTNSNATNLIGATVTVSGNNFSYSLTGLASNTIYYFRPWARNSIGWAQIPTALSFTTASASIQTWTVTPQPVANGTINPPTSQTVSNGSATAFTFAPNYGYTITSVGGTCGGTLSGTTYTTNAITANCTVSVTFTANQVPTNGACGTAINSTYTTQPTQNLCSSGSATPVTGAGPWNWNCNGLNGGSTASCTAYVTQTGAVPSCNISPTAASIVSGASQIFTASCTNSPLGYHWRVDGDLWSQGGSGPTSFDAFTGSVGSHTVSVTASNAIGASTVSATLTVTQPTSTQTIAFGAQTSPRSFVNGGTFTISPLATASSGLLVTYSSITPGVCSVIGTTVTMISAGTCIVAANQFGSASYSAAAQATQNVVLSPPPSCSLTPAAQTVVAGGTATLSASCANPTTVIWGSMPAGGPTFSGAGGSAIFSNAGSYTYSISNGAGGTASAAVTAAQASIPASERTVLTDIYASTNGASWTNNTGWMGAVGTECTWFGVTCDATQSYVTGISLNQNNLIGTLPTLSGLTALQYFYANHNQLTGSIPTLSGLTALQWFDVRNNQLSGSIPSLSGLTALQRFNALYNQLTGSIPSLSGLTALQSFSVGSNQLSGSIPSLSGLTALQVFDVWFNQLSGSIPSLNGLTALQYFNADQNLLTGSIPTLSGLTALQSFNVYGNQLTGSIPTLSGLTALQRFSVSGNRLTGSIPTLSGLTALQHFYVSSNQLTGSIPSLNGLTALLAFYVGGNQLTGSIPSLSGLTALQYFYVGNNQLTGSIPSLNGLTALQLFYANNNLLTGSIPTLSGLTALQYFNVSNNQLTGAVPSAPTSLVASGSNLCSNRLVSSGNPAIDAAWVTAAGNWLACQTSIPGAPTIGTATAGNAQATVTFIAPVSNGGSPITGYTVTSNPAGGTDSNTGTTGLSHVITGLTNGTAYTFTVRAINGVGTSSASAPSNAVTPKASQTIGTITFLPATLAVSGTTTASATATSSLAVTFTVPVTTSVCTVFGSTVTGVTAGTCTIAANQAGNASYNAAPQATQNITVGKANQTITFGAAPTIVVGGTGAVTATGGASGNAVIFTSTTTGICTVFGSTVTGVTAGTCTIAADQAGNANYNAATRVTQNITVVKANQTIGAITFAPATLIAGGTTLASATGGASGLPVTFTTASSACTATGTNGRTITGIAAGACIITANQAGNASYNPAPLRAQTLTVGAAPAPVVSLNRTALIFAARRPGTTSPAQAVTLRNTGTAALNITGIVASGDFARTTTCAATLAAGASCTINVTFTPKAMGARAGLVTLTSNAAGSPHRITLTGTGKGTRYDFNGDGKSDILWRNPTTGVDQIWFMNGAVKTSFANTTTQATGWTIAGVNDFNADGKADVLWRNAATKQTAIWLMNGVTLLSNTVVSPLMAAPWTVVGTGDFNGDGKADILWRNTTTGLNQIWFMNGAARIGVPANTTPAAIALKVAGVDDFNGDGKTDILWRNAATGQDTVWLMNGAAVMAGSGATGTLAAPWTIAGTGDFNGDGKSDILWRNTTNGLDSIWFMNGTAATGATTNAAATVWSVAGVADFNGDGKADITWRYPATGATALWLMNGAVRSAAATLTPAMLAPWSVAK